MSARGHGLRCVQCVQQNSYPSGIALAGGAIAIAILDLLVKKRVLTIDDVNGALRAAQGSLVNAPFVAGSLDGARIVAEITEQYSLRQYRSRWRF